MGKKILIISILLILLSSFVLAQQQYLYKGVDRLSSFNQDGTGVWTGKSPTTYTRSGSYNTYTSPIVEDVDNDGENEIIVINGEILEVLNYTKGLGLILESSFDIGTQNHGATFFQTPSVFDYDSDNLTEIIVFNSTHAMTLEHNTTNLVLEQSVSTGIGISASGPEAGLYPVVKCAPASQWGDSKDRCVIPFTHFTGAVKQLVMIQYNLDDNLANFSGVALSNDDINPANTHLADVNSDGIVEMVYGLHVDPNDDFFVYVGEVDATGNPSLTLLYSHLLTGTTDFSDLIVANLDGTLSNGQEISWAYTDDGTNFKFRTIDSTGAVLESSYCTVWTCPEGNVLGFNLWQSNGDYVSDPIPNNDVCSYIRDYDTGIDIIHCISLYLGATNYETGVSNSVNFSNAYEFFHQADLFNGNFGLISPTLSIQGSSVQSQPQLLTDSFVIPVDYEQSGTLDLIGLSSSGINYYDDAYTNAQVVIDSYTVDTGNPVCLNEIVSVNLDLTDAENDLGYCHIEELYGNSTVKSVSSNTSFSTPNTITLNYYADEIGTYILNLRCQDQFNLDSYRTDSYPISISNDTNLCNIKGSDPVTKDITSDEQAQAEEEFDDNIDSALSDIGVESQKAKGFVWLIVMIGSVFILFPLIKNTHGSVMIIAIVEVLMLVLGWFLGMISAIPLIMVGLVCVVVIVFWIMKGGNSTGV